MTYPVLVYLWSHERSEDGDWRYLCLVSDAESYGLLERLLGPDVKLKTVPYQPMRPYCERGD